METPDPAADDIVNVVQFLPRQDPFTGSWFEECEHEAEEWLIEGIVPKRSYILCYGRRGSAKTFFGIDLAARSSLGGKFLGQPCDKFGTLYCVGEKKSRFGKRVKAWRIAANKTRANVKMLWGCPNLLDPASVDVFIAYVNRVKPEFEQRGCPLGLVIMDTLVRAIGGANDSDFDVAGKATESIQRIIDECSVSVMPLHHMAKSKDADTARGAGVWEDAADTIIRIDRKEDDPIRTVLLTKQSDEIDGLKWAFKLEVVEVGLSPKGRTITSCIITQCDVPDDGYGGGRPVRLSAAAQKVMAAFNRLFDDGKTHPAPLVPGVASGTRAVTLNDLRDKARVIGLSAAAAPPPDADAQAVKRFHNTRDKAFREGVAKLEETKMLRQEQGFVWDPKRRGAAS